MRVTASRFRRGAIVTLLTLIITACGNDVSTSAVTSGQTLSSTFFDANVNPILDKDIGGKTCSSGLCHGINEDGTPSNGGTFKIYANPSTAIRRRANFLAAFGAANLNSPSQSKLLLKPLALSLGGINHGGDDVLFTTGPGSDYDVILTWISSPVLL